MNCISLLGRSGLALYQVNGDNFILDVKLVIMFR